MGKKNPFVTTVGFNRHDPAHVEVAQFLNGMERGKAQYIVDAVMAYQRGEQAGVPVLSETERMADYETIRKIVLQVMEERENGAYGSNMAAVYGGDLWDDFFARYGIMEFDPVPMGAVVTETETGSEMNGRAVITNQALKVRTGRDYPKCNPKFALIDPAYSCHVPKRQMVSDGFDTLSHMMEIYFSKPDEDNVSDDIAEALMKNVIQNLRTAIKDPQDYRAKSNLMWDAAMAENRILKLGKQTDFQCRQMEHQLAAYTNCNQGEGLAVLHPVYYRHIYRNGCHKFRRFAVNVWGISDRGKTEEETACEGVEALAGFIKEVGLPVTLRDLGADENTDLRQIADSCSLSAGSYKQMTHKEILEIFQECY